MKENNLPKILDIGGIEYIQKEEYDKAKKDIDNIKQLVSSSIAGLNDFLGTQVIAQSVDLFNLDINNLNDYKFLEEMLWARPYDSYTEEEINIFLQFCNCKFMCVGHTPYNGFHILGNQLIFDSSFCTDNKYYLDIDLSKDYKDIFEVLKCLEELE